MIKKLLFTCIVYVAFGNILNAQCRLSKDSTIQGNDTNYYEAFIYSGNYLAKVQAYRNNYPSHFDTLYYSGGNVVKKETKYYNQGQLYTERTVNYIYLNNKLSRISASGIRNNQAWTMAHDFTYNTSGEITDIVLDNSSVSGNPEGMVGSFRNMQWTNGNITYVDLVADAGQGIDTFECVANYDTKLNVARFVIADSGGDIIEYLSANNIISVVLVNNESIATAGTKLLDKSYTYYTNNEVDVATSNPAVFDNQLKIHKFYYDCSSSLSEVFGNNEIEIYPVPANGKLFFTESFIKIDLYNVSGKRVSSYSDNNSISLEGIAPGVYFVKILNAEGIEKVRKVVVQ